jgi:hypothetical protein
VRKAVSPSLLRIRDMTTESDAVWLFLSLTGNLRSETFTDSKEQFNLEQFHFT